MNRVIQGKCRLEDRDVGFRIGWVYWINRRIERWGCKLPKGVGSRYL
jgi:hypothetical protein